MLQAFRNFFKSKFGIVFTLAFLVVVAFAFASADVSNTGSFGGLSGGEQVAVVGDGKISPNDLSSAAATALAAARENNPTLTMAAFLTEERLAAMVDQMMQRSAIGEYGRSVGLRAGDRLVDSEIVKIAAFAGPDGKFSQDSFNAFLRQQQITEDMVRDDIAAGLFAKQLLLPAAYGIAMPDKIARRYTALLKERRKGAVAILPSAAFAPKADPSSAQLQAFYTENTTNYLRPERRVIRYATFGNDALKDLAAPSEAQIAARFKQDAATYAASETRRVTQLVLPTQAAAQAVVAEVKSGKALAASAREKGLATADIGPVSKAELETQASAAVANAAFAAGQGALSAPVRGPLGWYVMQVNGIERSPARTLAQVSGAIAATLAEEQRRSALADLSARVEEELDGGGSLVEVAKELGLTLETTAPATADGQLYLKPGETLPVLLAPALSTAFAMDEQEPQLAVLVPGAQFLVFEVTEITPSAAAPLAEVRERVANDWKLAEGSKAARAAADRVLAALDKGTSLEAALAAEKIALPKVEQIDLDRQQLQAIGNRVPPVFALLFSMAKGTSKKLEQPSNGGWFVAKLNTIDLGTVADDDPILAGSRGELAQLAEGELGEQMARAMLAAVGSETNQAAVKAVYNQLTGRSGQ